MQLRWILSSPPLDPHILFSPYVRTLSFSPRERGRRGQGEARPTLTRGYVAFDYVLVTRASKRVNPRVPDGLTPLGFGVWCVGKWAAAVSPLGRPRL